MFYYNMSVKVVNKKIKKNRYQNYGLCYAIICKKKLYQVFFPLKKMSLTTILNDYERLQKKTIQKACDMEKLEIILKFDIVLVE